MADAADILKALLGGNDPPATMGALEQALGLRFDERSLEMNSMGHFFWTEGPVGDVAGLSAKYAWDMYHESPATTLERLRSRRVLDFTVDLTRGRAAAEAALEARLGGARVIPNFRVYGRWLVGTKHPESDAVSLAHYDKLPDWAVVAPDPAVRARFLLDLVSAVAAAETQEALVQAASVAPPLSGLIVKDSSRGVALEPVPRIGAMELARILGWPNAIGESNDVHMSSWEVKLVIGASAYGPVTTPPVYGRWNVHATLERRPTGGDVARHPGGPIGRQHLGPSDLVWMLEFD